MSACPFRAAVAADLARGPAWAKSYADFKETIKAMVADGEVDRVAPAGARYRNMLALTQRGAVRYFGPDHSLDLPRSRAEECEVIAEIVADGGSLASAARRLGITYFVAQQRWRTICAGLGEQAR